MDEYERAARINRDPGRIQAADQMWAEATAHLDKVVNHIRELEPAIIRATGENTDSSVIFDWLKAYIYRAETNGGDVAHQVTMAMCAAAITKLVRAPRTDDPLAQLDKEIGK